MSKHARSSSQDDVLKHPSTKRAKEVDQHPPLRELTELLGKQNLDRPARNVLHWFRSKDIRMEDNKALEAASRKAREGNGSLLTLYLFSPRDMEWHGTSPARSDFILEGFRLVKEQLKKKNIPLAFVTAEERSEKNQVVLDFVRKHDVSHIYANFEYEVDELRRDINMAKAMQSTDDVTFCCLHDQTIVEPGAIKTGSGGPLQVFTPYHKAWLAKVSQDADLLSLSSPPTANDESATATFKDLFDTSIPELPESKRFASADEQSRIRGFWPAGHEAGMQRLRDFLSNKVHDYARDRSFPAKDPSSRLSAYFSSGTISVREAVAAAKEADGGANFDNSGDPGIASWVREIIFREFYRQMLVFKPHNAMNMPQNLKFDFVQYEEDEEAEQRWYDGKTGVPFIDAGMRQLNTEAYMHNRLRMNTSSYLRTNLLLDYRKGERYFAEHLVDWDLSNNTQGWEPSYTVFNPVSQAEKCDKDGEYIRRWVPELRDVKGKAVFAPHERLSKEEFEKLGYPRPYVDWKESKARALERFKTDMKDADP